MLKNLVPLIQKVTAGKNLTVEEAERAFMVLEGEDLEGYFYYTFLAALHTKGETSDELLGFCRANKYFVPAFDVGVSPGEIIDLSGTGGDEIKTLNVSTAAAFVVASAGVKVAKQAFFAVTGLIGSADLLQSVGADPLVISREGKERVKNVLNQTGMVVYHANSMADPTKRKGFFNFWLKKVPEVGLTFRTAYHLAANAYSPIPMERRIYGVFAEKYVKVLAELFQKLGYKKGLVFHGVDGLDEISNVGLTKIVEYSETAINEYTITPSDLGVATASVEEIRGTSRNEIIRDFLKIIYGIEKGPKRDLVLVNAAVAFYVMGKVSSLRAGTELALSQIEGGVAKDKLEKYVECTGDIEKLESLKKAILR